MRRIRRYLHHHFLPHPESGEKAIALRHEALFLYAVFLFLFQFGLSIISSRFPGVLGFASNISIEEIIHRTNQERLSFGLKELRVDGRLSQAAAEKATYMFAKDYWAHNAPDGTTPWFFVQRSNYRYIYAGENLAKDFQNSDDVVVAWMASKAGHRENILNNNYSDIGVSVVNGVLGGFETTLVVQMFGSEKTAPLEVAAAAPSPTSKVTSEPTAPAETQPLALQGPFLSSEKKEIAAGVPPVLVGPRSGRPSVARPLIPVVDVVALGKSISYTFGFFLLVLFLIDSLVMARRRLVRVSGHSLAHLMVVVLLLATTWLMSPGTIR